MPPIWILGSSDFGAQVAAALGVGFAFARHLNPRGAADAIARYREHFQPTDRLPAPRVILATSAICADAAQRAQDLAASMALGVIRLRAGHPAPLPTPEDALAYAYDDGELDQVRRYRRAQVVGTADEVRDELAELVRQAGADELMLMAMVHSHQERVHSYRLVAEALGLGAAPARAARWRGPRFCGACGGSCAGDAQETPPAPRSTKAPPSCPDHGRATATRKTPGRRMISYFQSIVLGIVQGVTEPFPVSSLGHSVIVPKLLGWDLTMSNDKFVTFLVATHFATALVFLHSLTFS